MSLTLDMAVLHGPDNNALAVEASELAQPPSIRILTIDEVIDAHVRRVLDACGGNKSKAARVLGIDRRSLYRHLARSVVR